MGTDYTNDPRPSPTDETREYDYSDPTDPDVLMEQFHKGARGEADIDMKDVLWGILADVQSSYRLALEQVGMNDINIESVEKTVTDYLTNHYGDD
jgi:hypothetical protein